MAVNKPTFTSDTTSKKPSAAFTLTFTYSHSAVVEFVEEVVHHLFDSPEEYLPRRLMPNTRADISPELLAVLPSRQELIKRVSVGDLRPLLERVVNDNGDIHEDFFLMMEDSIDDLACAIMATFVSTTAAIDAIVKTAEAREGVASGSNAIKERERDMVKFLRSKGYKITKK